ncbi:DNA mismatch repair protein Msh6 [Bacillus rossius redtenbacheri]|uniref:DNA mismatch repair protein Msh6 n=1 Tax=Bacillus rossius redtenbacheri TaxID=93214 RepID=UPI002FDEA85E
MAQKTLFSFFSKSPSVNKSSNPKEGDGSPGIRKRERSPGKSDEDRKTPKKINNGPRVNDVVWARLDGHPWWPGLVTNDPKGGPFVRAGEVHVQFFDRPPSRAWVRRRAVEAFRSGDDKPCPKKDAEKWRASCREAVSALRLPLADRNELVVDFARIEREEPAGTAVSADEGEGDVDKENVSADPETPVSKKRKVLAYDSEDSGDEYKPKKEEMEVDSDSASSGVPSETLSDPEMSDVEESPVKEKRSKASAGCAPARKSAGGAGGISPSAARVSQGTKAKLALFPSTEAQGGGQASETRGQAPGEDSWAHLKLDFLKPDRIRDARRRPPSHPEYDPKTLYVPEDFMRNQTPAIRQWWEMKSKHFDCVLFFKVGKFYELYHMDAVTGVNELGLMFMKGDKAHSGFPEVAYGRFSSSLIEKGYKVARVEQTETPDMVAERCRSASKTTKFDKVVKREICQIGSRGTKVYNVIDGESKQPESSYLLALTEKAGADKSTFGVCFVDTSIGLFHLGQFDDDRHCSRLRTLLAHQPPVQVLYERGALSERTQRLLRTALASVLKEALAPESEFWTAGRTLVTLAEGGYFASGGVHSWPEGLKEFLSESSSLGLSARDDAELAVRALGAVTWCLTRGHLDQQVLAMGRFRRYTPADQEPPAAPDAAAFPRHMILDGVTLHNLNVLENRDGGRDGTLLGRMDLCCTPFGKRLLHRWVCSPLCSVDSIRARQAAVGQLLDRPAVLQEARGLVSQLPDLERLLTRIHGQGNAERSKTHPDSRAIFFEDNLYSKKKIQDFNAVLSGFKCAERVAEMFQDRELDVTAELLVQCTRSAPEGSFPDMTESLHFFETAFDQEEATKHGRIIPRAGVDPEYDSVTQELQEIQSELDRYLQEQRSFFGCKVVYHGTDKKRFQLEVTDTAAKKAGRGYELQSQRKGFKRFTTERTKDLLARQISAEDQKKAVLKDLSRRIFSQFSAKYAEWSAAIQCLSVLDVLMAFAEYCLTEPDTCVPEFVQPSADVQPHVKVVEGKHPCLCSSDGFIPNDTALGCDGAASVVLVTGPNMGGKSTLMRQLGLLVVMAHMGCRVPAAGMRLTPVDRVFTRLGANDDLMAGESTFLVELSETSCILRCASPHSLVLVDELGRGTSTYDGTAIAAAVVDRLVRRSCRTLFSTHYHGLVEDYKGNPLVTLGHMACMVENESEDPSEETVTFLYKFAGGACPKSYGFNAARLAGVPAGVVRRGREKAERLERHGLERRLFQDLCRPAASAPELCAALRRLCSLA